MTPRWPETCSLAAIGLSIAACGTDAVGVQACKQVQEAQCRAAPACGIALEPPYRTSGTAVDECIRFYDVACLHGTADGTDPGPIAVDTCVAAIRSAAADGGNCSIVADPSTAPACAWMAVSSSAADASATSAEAATDDGGDAQ